MPIFSATDWTGIASAVAALMSAVAAIILLLVAKSTLFYQRRAVDDARLANMSSVVMSFSERWVSTDMLRKRKLFAQRLLKEGKKGDLDLTLSCPVLEFLEDLGYITKRGVVDQSMVWNSFSLSMSRYYLFLTRDRNRLEEARQKTGCKTIYREFQWLFEVITKIDAKENGQQDYQPPSDKLVEEFLQNEAESQVEDKAAA